MSWGAQNVEADVTRAAERCRTSGDDTLHRRFDDLARALGRESHWLRWDPAATAALVWNRLRRSGWTPEELDQQLQLPADARFLRVRHVTVRESPALERDLVGHAAKVNACAVTPDGRRVVSASQDRTLKIWDLKTGALVAALEGHRGEVAACAVTPSGQGVVSASNDGVLKVWDLETGALLTTLDGHASAGAACAVTPDGGRVVSSTYDCTLKVWDLASGECLFLHHGNFRYTAFLATPTGIIAGDAAGAVWFLDWPPANRQVNIGDHHEPQCQASPENDLS